MATTTRTRPFVTAVTSLREAGYGVLGFRTYFTSCRGPTSAP
jgi:hypothetical protein